MSLGMYALKPVFDLDAVVEHPTCVYRLPVIQSSMPIEGVGACSGVGAGAVAGGAVAALAARQEAILGRLEQLKEEVAAYQASLGLPTAPAAPAAQPSAITSASSPMATSPMARLKATMAALERLFAAPHDRPDVARPADTPGASSCVRTGDLVVRCPPSSPPHSLPPLLSLLASAGLSLHLSSHTHSSVSSLPPALASFLPKAEAPRAAAQVRLCLIWSGVEELELLVSPLTQSPIRGEANLLRYFARLFPSVLPYEGGDAHQQDELLDLVARLPWAPPRQRPALLRQVTAPLGSAPHLAGAAPGAADLALYSVVAGGGLRGELTAEAGRWFDGLAARFGGGVKEVKEVKEKAKVKVTVKVKAKEKGGKAAAKAGTPDGKAATPPAASPASPGPPGATSPGHLGREGLLEWLGQRGIEATTVEHPPVLTVEAMLPYLKDVQGAIVKNLFLKDKKKNLYLLSAEHTREVKLNDVAKAVGAKELRFGDEAVMEEVLGVSQGCVTAFALVNDTKRQVKFLVDRALVDGSHQRVNFHPLTNTATTAVTTEGFNKLLAATGHAVIQF